MHEGEETSAWRRAARSFLELLALCGLAITQPLLDVFGNSPETFILHGAGRSQIIWFALLVALVPAAALWAVEQVVDRLSCRLAGGIHIAFLSALAGLAVIQLLRNADLANGLVLGLLAVAAAALVALAYPRLPVLRQWTAIMALAPVAFVATFLISSPVSSLLSSQEVEVAEVDPAGSPRSVVMIVWDEWPVNSIIGEDGQIDATLYPNLARLAGEGTWLRNNTTVANATSAAGPAILTGRDPVDDNTPTASDYPENLFTLLAGQLDLEVIESVTALCPQSFCNEPFVDDPEAATDDAVEVTEPAAGDGLSGLFSDAWESFKAMVSLGDDTTSASVILEETTAAPTTTAPTGTDSDVDEAVAEAQDQSDPNSSFPVLELDGFTSLLASIEEDEDPTLHYLHLQFPHSPYRFLPDGRVYTDNANEGIREVAGSRSSDPYDAAVARQRLVLQTGYLDTLVGQLVDRLEETNLYDESVVVLTSDHGAGFVPGSSNRGLGGSEIPADLYPDLLYVPLIVKAPGLDSGDVRDDNVMTIDIVPTIADLLGIDIPWDVDGRSLRGPPRESQEKHFQQVQAGAGDGAPEAVPAGGPPDGGPPGDAPGGGGPGPRGPGGPASLGPRTTFDGAEYLELNLDRHLGTLFLGENVDYPLYDIADGGELVGSDVSDLTVIDALDAGITIENLGALDGSDDGGDELPVHVVGSASGATEDLTVVLAINGTIAGVGPVFDDGDDASRIEFLIAPELLDGGQREVLFYAIEGASGSRRLAPITIG